MNQRAAKELLETFLSAIPELYRCVSFSAPMMTDWLFSTRQKLMAIYGPNAPEVLWYDRTFSQRNHMTDKDEYKELSRVLGQLQSGLSEMRDKLDPRRPSTAPSSMTNSYDYDVFISHANVDKEDFVDELTASLENLHINIWYDATQIDWGDNWKLQIKNGLNKCRFGIVVISPQFLGREWTEKELNDLLQRQNASGQKVVLPLLFNLSVAEMRQQYPQLENFQAKCIDNDTDVRDITIDFARILIRSLKQTGVRIGSIA